MRGELKKAGDLFDKYRRILVAPEASVVNAFVEVVEDIIGIACPKNQIRYDPSTRVLSFVGGGVLRGECKIRETEILDHLRGRLGEKSAPKAIL